VAAKGRAALVLFDEPAHPLAAPLAAWGAASPRFTLFAEAHRDKIRKKARGARDAEALNDLLLELAVARDLHREWHGTLGYEQQLPERTRVPDFALTLPNGVLVIIEVTRIRQPSATIAEERSIATPGGAGGPVALDARLTAAICGKLSQLVPNLPNILVVGLPPELLRELDLAAVMRGLLGRAERRELTPRERHPFRTPNDFFRHYRNLSALLVRPWPPPAPARQAVLWTNRQATKSPPSRLVAALTAAANEPLEFP
jgi:hypothetical protein